ncbi:MAG: hypothetical protein GY774_31100 [Planctomycetes bacterium]|nr:hypothetical protein [Planctomycetota bacterium]
MKIKFQNLKPILSLSPGIAHLARSRGAAIERGIWIVFFNKQTQFTKCPKERKLIYNNELYNFYQSDESQKQSQFKPNQSQFQTGVFTHGLDEAEIL